MTSPRFPSAVLVAAVNDALVREGVPQSIASVEAVVMVDADLCGVPSHGVVMLPKLIAGLRDGRVHARPALRVRRDTGATCLLDCDRGPGRHGAATAMDHAVEKAAALGIGLCLAANTTHWGRAHAYARRAAQAGMIGLCTTNAIPTLTVPGIARAVLGNNPIAIGVPRAGGREPIVIDLAMTQAAFGKVATHRREGLPVPADWGVDAQGRSTSDPAAILASGLLLPMGGHKGVGLAILMELMTAALAGGPFGHEIAGLDATGLDPGASKLFIAIDVGALADPAFDARVESLLAHLKGIDPEHPVLWPGERGSIARQQNERDGVPLHEDIVGQLQAAGVM